MTAVQRAAFRELVARLTDAGVPLVWYPTVVRWVINGRVYEVDRP